MVQCCMGSAFRSSLSRRQTHRGVARQYAVANSIRCGASSAQRIVHKTTAQTETNSRLRRAASSEKDTPRRFSHSVLQVPRVSSGSRTFYVCGHQRQGWVARTLEIIPVVAPLARPRARHFGDYVPWALGRVSGAQVRFWHPLCIFVCQ